LDIRPISNRELVIATRKSSLWANRVFFAGLLLSLVLATFGARYYWDRGRVSRHDMMALVALQGYLWMLLAHCVVIVSVFAGRAVPSIALEKDRRTLDFLLATRLGNAEIVLGKFAAWMAFLVAELAVGLPIMLLLYLLGGIDPGLILLGYAALITTAFFMVALAIWISIEVSNLRDAAGVSIVFWMLWLIGPFLVSMVLPRVGLRPPAFVLTANAWVLTSSPLGLILKIAGGVRAPSQLAHAVAWMSALQVAGGTVLLTWSIARLRWAYRVNLSGDSQKVLARLIRPGWHWRPKPRVGDDPILWREMHTDRSGLLGKVIALVVYLGMYAVLAYVTLFFARPALIEVWSNGYNSGITSAEHPEWNLAIRFFMAGAEINPPADLARIEFNLYLRFITTPLVLLITLVASGMAAEGMIRERTRETWDSLVATPLTARDILRSNMLATVWRMRVILATLLVLWTIGLITGSLHPAGYLCSLLVVAAWTWLMLVYGTSTSIVTKDKAEPNLRFMGLFFLTSGTLALPYLLPRMMGSVLLGVGSPPFIAWLSLVSYRDVRNALHYPVYPALQWMHIDTGQSASSVIATCLIGIVIPTLYGLYLWRAALANFDLLIGRPSKTRKVSSESWPVSLASIGWMVGFTLSWLRRRDSIG
jgi:ABC-type transport system involved in multi-copper enzyme maturation permease subunit